VPENNKKILILGSGFSGTYLLLRLASRLKHNENVDVTMVSSENFFLFAPLLHEVATGAIEPRHIIYPIRRLPSRNKFNFIQASVQEIHLTERKVLTDAGILDFDYLVLALGSIADTSDLNSKGGNIFTLKTLHDARLLMNHIINVFEQANIEQLPEQQKQLLTFVVSGGGYIGVQFVAALRDFIYRDLVKLYRMINPDNIKIILVEKESSVLVRLHTKFRSYIMKQLQKMGIEVRLKSSVTTTYDDNIELNNSEIIPSSTLLWVTGVVSNPVKKDSIGRVFVNDFLEVPSSPRVYAVGDCAHFKDPRTGYGIPSKAHTGVRQAKIAADNILADISGEKRHPYVYSNPFEVVSLGFSKAIFSYNNFRLYGLIARFIWMASYTNLVTGKYNRIKIMVDWLLSSIFKRDVNILK
jgi:NADH dehydrogenase